MMQLYLICIIRAFLFTRSKPMSATQDIAEIKQRVMEILAESQLPAEKFEPVISKALKEIFDDLADLKDENDEEDPEDSDEDSDEDSVSKASFTDAPWSTPRSKLDAAAYCSVCLIDENPPGQDKIKEKCHLPVRSRPGAPVNKNALRNASARLSSTQASSKSKAKARSRLISLMNQAGIDTSLEKSLWDDSPDPVDISLQANLIAPTADPSRIAYGVVYPVFPPGETDTQHHRMSPGEIEKMAHSFLVRSRRYDIQHREVGLPEEDAAVVESYIAPVDFTIDGYPVTKGSWVVATKFSPKTWERVVSGELRAYSIRGKGRVRKPASYDD